VSRAIVLEVMRDFDLSSTEPPIAVPEPAEGEPVVEDAALPPADGAPQEMVGNLKRRRPFSFFTS
jgi:hypothetical protein